MERIYKATVLLGLGSLAVVLALVLQATTAEASPTKGDPYSLDLCPVGGTNIGPTEEPIVHRYEGRELRFCSEDCFKKFIHQGARKYLARVDAATVEAQKPWYPLETCIHCDHALKEGEAIDHVYKNRLVWLCSEDCVAEFEKDPAKYIAKLDEAVIAKQRDTYPVGTCVVMGGKLGPKPVEHVVANRLVLFCCAGCDKAFDANPLKYFTKLDEAAEEKAKQEKPVANVKG